MRVFAYCRVSTTDQTTDNQIHNIRNNGYVVLDNRVVTEKVSGGVCAMEREAFRMMVEHKLEAGDTLVVNKLDRLGRDAIDVETTIKMLMDKGIKVVSLDLPTNDLTSSEGTLILKMFTAFAQFEKDRISERTQDGLKRAKAEGKKLGRPAFNRLEELQKLKENGLSQSKVAVEMDIGIATVKRNWNKVQLKNPVKNKCDS